MTKMLRLPIIALLIICFYNSISAQQLIGDKKDIAKILENIEKFSGFYMNAMYAEMANSYTENGKIFPDKTNIIEGRKAIQARWTLPKSVKILKHKVSPSEIRIVDNYAYDYGTYEGETVRADGQTVTWKGKYVIVWMKQDDDWKIYLDIWNSIEE